MKQTLFLGLILISVLNSIIAQDEKRTNVWYFGGRNGIDFNTSPPSPLFDSVLY